MHEFLAEVARNPIPWMILVTLGTVLVCCLVDAILDWLDPWR